MGILFVVFFGTVFGKSFVNLGGLHLLRHTQNLRILEPLSSSYWFFVNLIHTLFVILYIYPLLPKCVTYFTGFFLLGIRKLNKKFLWNSPGNSFKNFVGYSSENPSAFSLGHSFSNLLSNSITWLSVQEFTCKIA